jgi:hypothetical protein
VAIGFSQKIDPMIDLWTKITNTILTGKAGRMKQHT